MVALLLVAAVWYLALTTVLSVVQHYIERHYGRGRALIEIDGVHKSFGPSTSCGASA